MNQPSLLLAPNLDKPLIPESIGIIKLADAKEWKPKLIKLIEILISSQMYRIQYFFMMI